MPSRRQTLRRAQEVIDELDDRITSEQRRLLCMALQLEYDQDYTEEDAFIDSSSEEEEAEDEESTIVRVRTVINIARPPSIWYVLGPLILQALISTYALWLR